MPEQSAVVRTADRLSALQKLATCGNGYVFESQNAGKQVKSVRHRLLHGRACLIGALGRCTIQISAEFGLSVYANSEYGSEVGKKWLVCATYTDATVCV